MYYTLSPIKLKTLREIKRNADDCLPDRGEANARPCPSSCVCVERGAAAAAKWAEKKRIKRSKCKRRKRRSCWPMAVVVAANLQIRERVSEQSISE
jgi:hypothetical protein